MGQKQIIEKYIKQFIIIKIKEIRRIGRRIEFTFDESTGVCLGTIIENIPIILESHTILPEFNYSEDTKLDTYYLYKAYDYGIKIPIDDGFILLQEEPEVLKKQYQEIIDWYDTEIVKNEKQNIKSFEKERAKLLEK